MQPEHVSNLNLVIGAWFAAIAAGDLGPIAAILDDQIVWEGRYPGQICQTPPQVLHFLSNGLAQTWRIRRLEAYECGDDVVIVAEGPDFEDVAPDGSRAPRSKAGMVLSIRDGRIVHMKGIDGPEQEYCRDVEMC